MSTDKSINTTISARIAQVITEAGESQRRVAARVGVSQGFISNVVTGSSQPSVTLLAGLCRHYHISGDWLLTGEGPMRKSVNAEVEVRRTPTAPILDLAEQALAVGGEVLAHLEGYMRGHLAARAPQTQRARAG